MLSGGRDHLTHRLLEGLGSCRRVALALAGAQAVISGLAIALLYLVPIAAAVGAVTLLVSGVILIAVLEAPEWGYSTLRAQARVSQPEESMVTRSPAQDESAA